MLDVNYGELGEIAKFLGLEIKKPPLAYPNSALASIIALTVWKWSGYNMVLYYSAILLVPILVLGKSLNLMNNLFGVILPLSALRAPFMLLILKNSIDDHPVELYESAFVDGCSRLRMLFSIALPLSKPTLLVVTIFVFMDSWNEFFLPLALLRSPDKMTITVVPTRFFEEFGADQPKIFAASVLIVQPVIIVYLLLQKYFEMGFTTGAVKG